MSSSEKRDLSGRRRRYRRTVVGTAGAIVLALAFAQSPLETPTSAAAATGERNGDAPEYQVKAAFLFNFVRYTSWPESSFDDSEAPFVVSVVGPDPFAGFLEKTFKDKVVDGRGFVLRHYKEIPEELDAHLAFTAADEDTRQELIKRAREHPVLVVGDDAGVASEGAQVGFFTQEKKVRFEVNVSSVKRAQLKMSSELLKLARIVREEDDE